MERYLVRLRRVPVIFVLVPIIACLTVPSLLQAAPSLPRVYLPVVVKSYSDARYTPHYDGAFGYGMNLATSNQARVAEMGFGYVKLYVPWASWEQQKGVYYWDTNPTGDSIRQFVDAAIARNLRVVIRVDNPPSWAAPGSGNRPPDDAADFGSFMGALAQHLRGRVAAYEIWNEPNLTWEWGNRPPSPEAYVDLLKAAYPRIKAADSQVVVISAGLATTGGDGGATAIDDLQFIERMYNAGAKDYFDALGSHPYGFASPPDVRNPGEVLHFQRAADQHALMASRGDGAKQIWATEMGWLIDPAYYGHPEYIDAPAWAGRQWQRVSPDTQADYLLRAFNYAYANWPWMAVMLPFNLDFSTVDWYPAPEPMRWYSILNPDSTPRPAFNALKGMAKPASR